MAEPIRLTKLIAARGVASRREAEALIEAGDVTVNGEVVRQVVPVDPDTDRILIRGRPLQWGVGLEYFAMGDDDNEHDWGAFLQVSFPLESPRWGRR